MRTRALLLFGITAVILSVIVGSFLRHISVPRIVGRAVAPDGTEMCIVQQCNWSAELFTTSFVYRKPDGPWKRFYFDHQDGYWGRSRVVVDPDRGAAVFYRGAVPAVTFAWAKEEYTLHRRNHTSTGTDWQMPAGWGPQLSVYSH